MTEYSPIKVINKDLVSTFFDEDLKCFFFFFFIRVFFHEHSRFAGQQGKGEGIYLTPLYHFHPLHRRLDISRGDYCRELTSAHSW